ncbi:F-box only protein 44-like [Rhineura floridana]|uniref:F-box only protein 44-like n=1 Tax=Rhineura floridana TaxID=261503 RepID=UPI002AC89162|nr:F-box only protein 44-like [Rhineura floridana]XP_061458092.1 F-box only protein 44-like [Rhineura floridana]
MANIGDLPNDIMLDIFSLVPMNELILNCRLVCSQWRELVDLPILWKCKYRQKNDNLKKSKAFYVLSHLERNLIRNPCGEEGLDFWETETPPRGQWKMKEVSEMDSSKLQKWDILQRHFYVKDDAIPYQEVNTCFAACSGLCVKSQLITLKDEGYWDELMDEARPTIVVKDWFYGVLGHRYQLSVKLLSADFKVIREYCSKDLYDCYLEDEEWREVSHTFCNFPAGVRHIFFQHQSQNVSWQESGYLMRTAKLLRLARCMKIDRRMRITKSSVTIGPFSLDKRMYYKDGRDMTSCSFVHFWGVQCPCRGNYIHW